MLLPSEGPALHGARVPAAALTSLSRAATANLWLLLMCLLIGFAIYRGRLVGQGDDLANLSPYRYPSQWAYVKTLYLTWGQVAFGIMSVPWRTLVRLFGMGPDSFPWWLPASGNLFFNIAAPVNFAIAGVRSRALHLPQAAFLLALVLGYWALNPLVYNTSLQVPMTMFGSYTGPLYLTSLAVLVWSRADFGARRRHWVWALGAYGGASINTPTFLLTLPLLVLGFGLLKALNRTATTRRVARMCTVFWLTSAAGLLFVWMAPGFHQRLGILGPASGGLRALVATVPSWYAETIASSYTLLGITSSVLFHTLWLVLLTAGAAVTASQLWLSRAAEQVEALMTVMRVNLLALTFLVAFHGSMATLLFVSYFPPYTRVYPMLLLVLAGLSTLVWADRMAGIRCWRRTSEPHHVRGSQPTGVEDRGIESVRQVATLAVLVLSGWSIAVPNLEASVTAYRSELRATGALRFVRTQIMDQARTTGHTHYRLSRCPTRLEAYSSRGMGTWYFNWAGRRDIAVVVDGTGDPGADRDPQADWTVIPCSFPPLVPWTFVPRAGTPAVRTVVYNTADGRGAWDTDFWVAPVTTHCSVTGYFNPLVKASHAYQDTFLVEVLFSSTWDYGGSPPGVVRAINPHVVGHARSVDPMSSVSVSYVYKGLSSDRVPLDAFDLHVPDDRPLVRVTIATAGDAFLTATSDVQLDCR